MVYFSHIVYWEKSGIYRNEFVPKSFVKLKEIKIYFRLVSLKNLLAMKKKWEQREPKTEHIHFNTQFRYHGFVREICIFWQLVRTRTQQICVFKRLIIVQQMNGHCKLNGSKSVMQDYMVKWNWNTIFAREFYLINSTVSCVT